MESEKSGFVNEMSEIWRKMQVKKVFWSSVIAQKYISTEASQSLLFNSF